MDQQHLATYLNDHLAGSVAAIKLLEELEDQTGPDATAMLSSLKADILADQRELEGLMTRLHVRQSPPRKAAAWLSEKLAEFKLKLDDKSFGPLWLLEALEALSLGIAGKQCLWQSLLAVKTLPELNGIEFERLAQRAQDQRSRVEAARVDAARAAFMAAS
jgi:hypothetical protein